MIRLGLTGSIGMGKSTTAGFFRDLGVPVHDADASVHALYAGRAASLIEAAFPGTTEHGVVDRVRLGAAVLGKPEALARLEAIVHPLVRAEEAAFLTSSQKAGHSMAVIDIPLLFESGRARDMDLVVVVTAAPSVQQARVLARPGMTEEKFAAIRARQMDDGQKRQRAHMLIETDRGLDDARHQVKGLVRMAAQMLGKPARAISPRD
jgi:dephospho-CoA kinase